MIELLLVSIVAFQDPIPPDDPTPKPVPEEEAGTPAKEDATEPAPVADPPAPLDLSPPGDSAELADLLRTVAARYPDLASLEVLEVDGAGHEITMLVLGDVTAGDPKTRPALGFYAWTAGGHGQAATLALVDDLLQGPPEHQALLRSATVYVIPALHLARPEPGERKVQWRRNFPVGWQPSSVAPGSGDVPLSEPETRALAGFLQSHPNLSLLVEAGLGSCSGEEVPGLLGAADSKSMERLLVTENPGAPGLRAQELCPGHPATFAWSAYGVFPARLPIAPSGEGEAPAPAARLQEAVRAMREATTRLPRISVGEPTVEALRPGLMRLDLSLNNGGMLPTLSGIGSDRGLGGEVILSVEGGAVLACASGESADALVVEKGREGRFQVGQIPGGGSLELCLLIEAVPGAELTITCESPRAGAFARTVTVE